VSKLYQSELLETFLECSNLLYKHTLEHADMYSMLKIALTLAAVKPLLAAPLTAIKREVSPIRTICHMLLLNSS
jgi:hypothetical protein